MPDSNQPDEIHNKLQKLKTLAERGSPNERDNARLLFEKLCKKYKISIEDITLSDEKKMCWFKYTGGDLFRKLLMQCIYKTVGITDKNYSLYKRGKTRNLIGVECTIAQGIEIELDYAFYSEHLKIELQRLTEMFIQRNDIFPPNGPVGEGKLTADDIKLACAIKKQTRVLQVTGDNHDQK